MEPVSKSKEGWRYVLKRGLPDLYRRLEVHISERFYFREAGALHRILQEWPNGLSPRRRVRQNLISLNSSQIVSVLRWVYWVWMAVERDTISLGETGSTSRRGVIEFPRFYTSLSLPRSPRFWRCSFLCPSFFLFPWFQDCPRLAWAFKVMFSPPQDVGMPSFRRPVGTVLSQP
jgi:hypothetical protein